MPDQRHGKSAKSGERLTLTVFGKGYARGLESIKITMEETMTEKVYLVQDVVRFLTPFGVTRDVLKAWLYMGFIYPSVQKASGSGTRNFFSFEDILQIALFKRLVDFGGGTRVKVAAFLSDQMPGSSFAKARREGKKFLVAREKTALIVGDVPLEKGESIVRKRPPKKIERLVALGFADEIPMDPVTTGMDVVLAVWNIDALEHQIRRFCMEKDDESE
jgi:hypothetical protein